MENTVVARSSDDFWPQDPASHTTHVGVNAYNSLFMGAVVQPDWDMFHSRHPAGLLHATARMVRPLFQQHPNPLSVRGLIEFKLKVAGKIAANIIIQ